jgi:LysR family cys regulon transcriptional activator
VKLALRQGNPQQCRDLVRVGQADLAICSATSNTSAEIVQIPCYRLQRSVITPLRHALLRKKPLTLESLSGYPIITYDEAFSGHSVVGNAFAERGLAPEVVLSAVDADVTKAYVEMGLGIAIIATVAFDAGRDTRLRRIDARHLFPPTMLTFVLRKHAYLRKDIAAFLQMFAPTLPLPEVDAALRGDGAARSAAVPDL